MAEQPSGAAGGLGSGGADDAADEAVEWPTSAEAYTLEAEVGYGAFATVYRASCDMPNGGGRRECAVKILDLEELNVNWEETRREIMVMKDMRHPNLVPVLQALVVEEELWIVMPLLDGGSCTNVIKETRASGIKDDSILARLLLDTVKGLAYLHANSHIHRDLKASNILVSGTGSVMVGDFGVVGSLMEPGDRKKHRTTFTGTPCWMAPEVMEQRPYDEKADIWSLGITALELAYGRAPYSHYQPMKVMMVTLQSDPPTADIYKDNSYKFSSKFASFVEKCLRKEPGKRPSAAKLLEHKFLKKACDDQKLVEFLIRPLPALGHDTRPIPKRKKDRKDQSKRKPISVGSWVFNPDDMAAMAAEVKEADAAAAAADDDAADADAAADDGRGTGDANEQAAVPAAAPAPAPAPADQPAPAEPSPPAQSGEADQTKRKIGRFTVSS